MANDALKSHMAKFYDANHNQTKGIGRIVGMNGTGPMNQKDVIKIPEEPSMLDLGINK